MADIAALSRHLGAIEARAEALDETALFPSDDMRLLAELGLCTAPLRRHDGGDGAGTEAEGKQALLQTLSALGRANPSVGRLFEAHVNVIRLIDRYGTPDQRACAAAICRSGQFLGLWVTDAPGRTVRRESGVLSGAKGPCSGAGHLRHALVTATEGPDVRMGLIELRGDEPVQPLGARLHGMRASANGVVTLDGTRLPDSAIIGQAGDYLREPDLSVGAWRTMAVTSGALDALVDTVRAALCARGHDASPLQQARFGQLLVAQGAARLWTRQAADVAEAGTAPVEEQVATVNLARIGVESACLDGMRQAQRALGLSAMLRPHRAERLLRDLATYLRQPAPDDVLTEAARYWLRP